MKVITKIAKIRSELKNFSDKKIVFVPTMGALHDGHLALVSKAKELGDIVVVSIFVNKAQFNDLRDYEKYPRQNEEDLKKLEQARADYVFLPDDQEMFASKVAFKIIPTALVDCLCGSARVGHFDGVALIVSKLFNIVKPQIAIFGEKDFQQLQVIKKLVSDFNFDVEIFSHDIVREKSGLAMSSRNQRLDDASKIKAANIYKVLLEIREGAQKNPQNLANILREKSDELIEMGFEKIDYLEVRKEDDLSLVSDIAVHSDQGLRIFIAVYLQGIRLIDNLPL